MNTQAVVTGIGVVAPNGIGADAFWKATREGVAVLDAVTREGCRDLPLRVAGEVRGFEVSAVVEDRYTVQTDRFTHFAMAAADQAIADSGLRFDEESPFDIGVVTAACSGGGEFGQRELQHLWGKGPNFVGPYQSIAWFYAASTGQISIRGGFKGPCGVVASDEAGGLDAISHACRNITRGNGTRAVVVGAAEAPLAPYSGVCQLDTKNSAWRRIPNGPICPSPGTPAVSPSPRAARCSWSRTPSTPPDAGPRCRPSSRGTVPPSPGPRAGRSPVRDWPAPSATPSRKPGAHPGTSMSSSPTHSAPRRPTAPRRWPWPTCSASAPGRFP